MDKSILVRGRSDLSRSKINSVPQPLCQAILRGGLSIPSAGEAGGKRGGLSSAYRDKERPQLSNKG